jgi:hypothetical protein
MNYNEFNEYCKTKHYCSEYKEKIKFIFREITRPDYRYWIKTMDFKYKEKGKRKNKMIYDVEFFISFVCIDGKEKTVKHTANNFRSFDFDSLELKLSNIVNK